MILAPQNQPPSPTSRPRVANQQLLLSLTLFRITHEQQGRQTLQNSGHMQDVCCSVYLIWPFFFGFVLTYPVTAFFLINLPVTSFINNFPMNDKSFCRSSRDVMRLRNSLSVDWPNGRFIDDSVFFNSHIFQFHSFRHCAMEHSLYDDAVDSDTITYQEIYWN